MKKEEIIIQKIMQERISKKISQQEMAEFLDIDKRTYYNIENGKSGLTIDKYIKICEVLHIHPSHFFGGDGNHIIEPENCFIVSNNDYGTMYFSSSEEQMKRVFDSKK